MPTDTSPALRSEKDKLGGGVYLRLEFFDDEPAEWFEQQRMEQLSKRFPHRGPGSLFGDQSWRNSVHDSRYCARSGRVEGRTLSGGEGPKRRGSRSPGTIIAPLPV